MLARFQYYLRDVMLHRTFACLVGSMLGVILVIGTSGCKQQPAWEVTHPATGTIKFKGRPLENAELALFPTDGSFPDTVRPKARSGADGQFVIWTYAEGDGAPAGTYKVTAVHHEVGVSKDTVVAKPNDLPAKYSKRDTTDLEITIAPGKNELPAIEIK